MWGQSQWVGVRRYPIWPQPGRLILLEKLIEAGNLGLGNFLWEVDKSWQNGAGEFLCYLYKVEKMLRNKCMDLKLICT